MLSDTLGPDNGGDSGSAYSLVSWPFSHLVTYSYWPSDHPTIWLSDHFQPATPRSIRPSRWHRAPTLPRLS